MLDRVIQDLEAYKKILEKVVRVQTAFCNYCYWRELSKNPLTTGNKDLEMRVIDSKITHEKEAFELNLMLTHLSDSGIPSGSILYRDFDDPLFKALKREFNESKEFDQEAAINE